jgi:hypothetical protein
LQQEQQLVHLAHDSKGLEHAVKQARLALPRLTLKQLLRDALSGAPAIIAHATGEAAPRAQRVDVASSLRRQMRARSPRWLILSE